MTLRTGLRNSSTGVPMVTITGPLHRNLARLAGEEQPLIGQRLGQQFVGAVLEKRQTTGLERVETVVIDVVDVDCQTLGRKRQHQRDADMTGAADDGQISGLRTARAVANRQSLRRSWLLSERQHEGAERPHEGRAEQHAVDGIIDR